MSQQYQKQKKKWFNQGKLQAQREVLNIINNKIDLIEDIIRKDLKDKVEIILAKQRIIELEKLREQLQDEIKEVKEK